MSRVKGRYVAQIVFEWDRERDQNMLPIEKIKENAKQFPQVLKERLLKETDASSIEVTVQYCDFWEVEDE